MTDVNSIARVATMRLSWGLALLVLGMRLGVFHYAGGPLPYYDQWVLEFNNIFLMVLNGDSVWAILFTPHNEHMPVTTKLLSLAGFVLNGYWDVKFLVVVAALVRAGEAVIAFRMLATETGPLARALIWAACCAVYAAPLSGYNLLNGMQVSFFLAHIAVFWAVHSVLRWDRPGPGALQLGLGCVLGLLSLSAALALPAAVLAVALMHRRRRPGFWPAWWGTLIISGAYVIRYLASSTGERVLAWRQAEFFLQLFSWPFLHAGVGFVLLAWLSVVLWRRSRAGKMHPAFLAGVGIAAFAAANAAMLALNREAGEFHQRHWDTISLLPLGLVGTGLVLADGSEAKRAGLWAMGGLLAVMLCFFGLRLQEQSLPYLRSGHAQREAAVRHYRELFLSGGLWREAARINAMLAERDYRFFDDPVDRFMPHPTVAANIVRGRMPVLALLPPEIIPAREVSFSSRVVSATIGLGGWLLVPGAGLALAGLTGLGRIKPQRMAEGSGRPCCRSS